MRCRQARKNISLALDGRLATAGKGALQQHLRACRCCREWQSEQSWLHGWIAATPEPEAGAGFQAGLMRRIAGAGEPGAAPAVILLRPAWRRAAAALLFVSSALLGLFIGGRLESAAPAAGEEVLGQALNLDAFADLPGDSFGAVYEGLLQEERP